MPRADRTIVEKAIALAESFAQRAPEADRARCLPPETVEELRQSGLLALTIPKSSGGLEANYATLMQVTEIFSAACASTSWCFLNHTATVLMSRALLGEKSAPYIQEVVDEGAILAHAQAPSGSTKAASGGLAASGRWPFVSFSNYSRWVFLSTMVDGPPPDWTSSNGETPPLAHNRWLWLKLDGPGVTIEDTWNAMAMRATMSNDVVLNDVFVSEELAPVMVRPLPETVWVPNEPPNLRLPYTHIRALMGGVMLGIAQAALAETLDYAAGTKMTVGGNAKTSMPGNQFAVADAAMYIESARAYLYQQVYAFMQKAESGEAFVLDDVIKVQMACLVARENAQKAVDRLFSIRGAHGLSETSNFERYYRDVRIGTLHSFLAPDLERELIGKHYFGIPADVQPRWA
jgi:alkylation response protein AidB-like acyl-CoA dehydrogenase